MTTPPGPPPGDSPWSRPPQNVPPHGPPQHNVPPQNVPPRGTPPHSAPPQPPHQPPQQPVPPARPVEPPSQSATRQMNVTGRGGETPTRQITPPRTPGPQPEPATDPDGGQPPAGPPPANGKGLGAKLRGLLTDPVSILLIVVTVIALVAAGVIGAELYARHVANSKVSTAAQCEIQDGVQVSFGVTPPVLWQHFTGRYTNIVIHSDGARVRHAKDMTVDIQISDVDLTPTADAKGTIGTLEAAITWTTTGIKETVESEIPILGGLAVKSVKTNPNDGTVELKGTFSTIVAKPTVTNGGFGLEVVKFDGLGLTLPRESIQSMLDGFTKDLTKDYPLGIKADSVEVTDNGVVARLSTHNAAIPTSTNNPCFADI
ncbi:DUF2993 domain-containing protein [Mycolicibacillus trivialis]|nr:DUF2993 domain-containing protein [Mycolicibacillus trivialis]